jgi:hypothetical protein
MFSCSVTREGLLLAEWPGVRAADRAPQDLDVGKRAIRPWGSAPQSTNALNAFASAASTARRKAKPPANAASTPRLTSPLGRTWHSRLTGSTGRDGSLPTCSCRMERPFCCCEEPSAGWLAPRTLNVLLGTGALHFGACPHSMSSGTGTAVDVGASPLNSSPRPRDATQQFRHEPS